MEWTGVPKRDSCFYELRKYWMTNKGNKGTVASCEERNVKTGTERLCSIGEEKVGSVEKLTISDLNAL